MLLSYFTEDAYDKLLSDVSVNAEKYSSNDSWLEDYFGSTTGFWGTSQSVDVGKFSPAYKAGKKDDFQKTQDDLVNTRMLYSAFKNLTPLQASNKYMWTYLCHAVPEYSAYIRDRWMQDQRENTIRTRFFVTDNSSLLNDNALSRLWWYGHLTYDEKSSDPFELTKILLTNQTICTDVMDTYNRMNITRIRGVLYAIRDFKETIDGKEGITDYFRECKKYLNHYAAVSSFDYLSSDEIRNIAFDYMVELRKKKRSK